MAHWKQLGVAIAAVWLAACEPVAPAMDDPTATGLPSLTLPELAQGLAAGDFTSAELTGAYIDRIERVDPLLQSVLAINPAALEQARASDERRAGGTVLGPLDGIPILLKDNIETADPGLATTAGALALEDNVTGRDSPLVAGLRAEGAVILGKTNLSQWANFRSESSISGWSALGGQVRNPHMLDRSPCGSSSGSGAAAAASLAAGTVGTETNGSIICPANVNGVVGFKPTVGLVSQDHIIPISSSQDTAGPMTRTVTGAAMMLTAMATGPGATDYTAALDASSLDGLRIGVLRSAEGSNGDVIAAFDKAIEVLAGQGAILVEINEFDIGVEGFWGLARSVLDHEFKATLNSYLANAPADLPVRSLAELIAYNEAAADIELALFDQSIFEGAAGLPGLDDPGYIEARETVRRATGPDGIDRLMAENDVAVLVSPSGVLASHIDAIHGDVWPAWAGAGWMAAISGYPHASVPMGTVHGLPIGLSFIASAGQDGAVLSYAYAYEQASQARAEPQYLATAEQRPELAAAMAGRP